MSRPFCSHVAMLQDGASSGVFFVNKLALPLVDFKTNVIKWIALRVVQFWSEIKLVTTYRSQPVNTVSRAIRLCRFGLRL